MADNMANIVDIVAMMMFIGYSSHS